MPNAALSFSEGSILVHNASLRSLLREAYSAQQIHDIRALLVEKGTLEFPVFENGLFPAAALDAPSGATAPYRFVWLRDNVYIAYSHYVNGQVESAVKNVRTLAAYFMKHRQRFTDVITGTSDAADPMQRPHVRFEGTRLEEVDQKWAHAQNDALGYFLWLLCKLAAEGAMTLDEPLRALIDLFVKYFSAVSFWEDEDSGHWEEVRKINASSIGVVTGALRELTRLTGVVSDERRVNELCERGEGALRTILPAECTQADPKQSRPYDAALLFLIYPMDVVDRQSADAIIANVVTHLRREIGVCRYLGDSYWAADYKSHFHTGDDRTRDFSDDMAARDSILRPGQEAQWCIFDPILSAIHGARYRQSGDASDLRRQTFYLNRSLAHITEDFRCPELYYLEGGQYVTGDHVPLLWTQANLWVALSHLEHAVRT